MSICLSVCLIFDIFVKIYQKNGVPFKIEKITGTLHEDLRKFLIISRRILIRMRNVSGRVCRESQNTHFVFNNFFRKSCRLWDIVENCGKVGHTLWCMRFAWWITNATDTHTHTHTVCKTYCFYAATLLREHFSILRYVHIACLFTADCTSYFTFWLEQLRKLVRNVSGQCKLDVLTAMLPKIRISEKWLPLGEWFLTFSGTVMSSPSSSCAACPRPLKNGHLSLFDRASRPTRHKCGLCWHHFFSENFLVD
jgi:hypothetical protein